MPLRRRLLTGSAAADPLCPYDALRAMWADRVAAVPDRENIWEAKRDAAVRDGGRHGLDIDRVTRVGPVDGRHDRP
eukprot:3214221-Pleurochrysis_carterae.AAC.1